MPCSAAGGSGTAGSAREGDRLALCLMGPTAAGKTEWAAALARRFALEIVSVDSVQVYRGMDIGTAKPDASLRREIPHHLIDVADPEEAYSAGRFLAEALAAMEGIAARGRLPLLAGGTGLYFRTLRRGLSALPPADARVRARLDAEAAVHGWPALHARLARLDPESAARIRPRDGQRIQRALEVHAVTGRALSELQRRETGSPAPGWRFFSVALIPGDRAQLSERIAARFQGMMERGLLAEVSRVYRRRGVDARSPAMRAVGYRQLRRHLDDEIDRQSAVTAAITATRQLAKRQLTWLRAEPVELVLDPFTQDVEAAVCPLLEGALRKGRTGSVIESMTERHREKALSTGRSKNQK